MSKSETSSQQFSSHRLPAPILELFTLIGPSSAIDPWLNDAYTREIQLYVKRLLADILDENPIAETALITIKWLNTSEVDSEILTPLTEYILDESILNKLTTQLKPTWQGNLFYSRKQAKNALAALIKIEVAFQLKSILQENNLQQASIQQLDKLIQKLVKNAKQESKRSAKFYFIKIIKVLLFHLGQKEKFSIIKNLPILLQVNLSLRLFFIKLFWGCTNVFKLISLFFPSLLLKSLLYLQAKIPPSLMKLLSLKRLLAGSLLLGVFIQVGDLLLNSNLFTGIVGKIVSYFILPIALVIEISFIGGISAAITSGLLFISFTALRLKNSINDKAKLLSPETIYKEVLDDNKAYSKSYYEDNYYQYTTLGNNIYIPPRTYFCLSQQDINKLKDECLQYRFDMILKQERQRTPNNEFTPFQKSLYNLFQVASEAPPNTEHHYYLTNSIHLRFSLPPNCRFEDFCSKVRSSFATYHVDVAISKLPRPRY